MARPAESAARRMDRRKKSGSGSRGNRKVRPARKTKTGIWILVMALFFVQALFYVWCRVQCVSTGYGIDREMRRRQALTRERNTLNIEMARLKSPDRIARIAKTQLGLAIPEPRQVVVIR